MYKYNVKPISKLPCAGITSTLVIGPLNNADKQGSQLTLHCTSDDSTSVLSWYNSLCVTTASNTGDCTSDLIYTGYIVTANFQPRFQVTAVNNATHITRDLIITSIQLTDGGEYLCAEERPGVTDIQPSSSQLIVLGNYTGLSINLS